jgi:hypothetical protein
MKTVHFSISVPLAKDVTLEELAASVASALRSYTGSIAVHPNGWLISPERPSVVSLVNRAEVTPAASLARQVNDILFARGAPLGSDPYFAIRGLLAARVAQGNVMTIVFNDRLDDGREVEVTAGDFTEDRDVGLNLGPEEFWVALEGTGFPVSLTIAEEDRLRQRACDVYLAGIEDTMCNFWDVE